MKPWFLKWSSTFDTQMKKTILRFSVILGEMGFVLSQNVTENRRITGSAPLTESQARPLLLRNGVRNGVRPHSITVCYIVLLWHLQTEYIRLILTRGYTCNQIKLCFKAVDFAC